MDLDSRSPPSGTSSSRLQFDAPFIEQAVLVLSILLILPALGGCADLARHDTASPDGTAVSPDASVDPFDPVPCYSGDLEFLLASDMALGHTPGWAVPPLYTISHSGVLTWVNTYIKDEGVGRVRAPHNGSLHNLTTADVFEMLYRFDHYRKDLDYEVTLAFRDNLTDEEFTRICQAILTEFQDIGNYTSAESNLADSHTHIFTASTTEGDHSARYYQDGDGPDAWHRFHETLETILSDHRARYPPPPLPAPSS